MWMWGVGMGKGPVQEGMGQDGGAGEHRGGPASRPASQLAPGQPDRQQEGANETHVAAWTRLAERGQLAVAAAGTDCDRGLIGSDRIPRELQPLRKRRETGAQRRAGCTSHPLVAAPWIHASSGTSQPIIWLPPAHVLHATPLGPAWHSPRASGNGQEMRKCNASRARSEETPANRRAEKKERLCDPLLPSSICHPLPLVFGRQP